jgi:hypothetical protein
MTDSTLLADVAARLRAAGQYDQAARVTREARRARREHLETPDVARADRNHRLGTMRKTARLMIALGAPEPARQLLAAGQRIVIQGQRTAGRPIKVAPKRTQNAVPTA